MKLLEQTDIVPNEMLLLPSIVWSLKLTREQLSGLLEPLSARDLAESLIGPEQAKEHLLNALPDAKKALVMRYASKGAFSRGPAFFEFCHLIATAVTENIKHEDQLERSTYDDVA